MPVPIIIAEIAYGIGVVVGPIIAGLFLGGCIKPREKDRDQSGDRDLCTYCHTSPNDIPTSEFRSNNEERLDAHKFHLSPRYSNPINCFRCHPAVSSIEDHQTGEAEVNLSGYDQYNSHEKSCSVYCHGDTKMYWEVNNTNPTLTCTSCHKETDPPHDIDDLTECNKCHDETVDGQGNIISKDLHINLAKDVVSDTCIVCHTLPESHRNTTDDNCSECHPEVASPFRLSQDDPHRDGQTSFKDDLCTSCHSDNPTSGAHQSHISTTSPIACNTCHNDPPSINNGILEHTNPELWSPVQFSGLSDANNVFPEEYAVPVYDLASRQCLNIYCHGHGLPEGQFTAISWHDTWEPAENCSKCHGNPPQYDAHPKDNLICSECHGDTPGNHINGTCDFE